MNLKRFKLTLACAVTVYIAPVQAQLRIVDYNTGGAARSGIGTILAAIGAKNCIWC